MSKRVIDVVRVSKTYRRGVIATKVLDDLSLSVGEGECVFLAGPSGSGKTTLLSIIGCVLSHDDGDVSVLGENLKDLTAQERTSFRLQRVGFLFQRFHLIRGLTALENVCVPLTLSKASSRTARQRGLFLLEAVGLADRATEHPTRLSTGQCQRVALARALAGNPDLILCDEPTASLDAENGRQVMAMLRRLTKQEGKTAIVVTHDARIFSFADRILWLENGHIASTVSGDEMANSSRPLSV